MNSYRYILEPYKGMNSRYRCPECNKGKTFSRYIDTETGEQLADHAGRCERLDNCSYHYTPKQYFQDNNISFPARHTGGDTARTQPYTKPKPYKPDTIKKAVSIIPVEVFKQSLKSHEANHFVQYLLQLFGSEITKQLIEKYFIGTSKHWPGANVFWQIDIAGKVRTGKIMLYNPTTGKRVKEPCNYISWVHTALKLPEFELQQCFFGNHLLNDKIKPIAICESEKTAIIACVYLPQFIWIAAGSKDGLNAEKCKVLAGRNVTLFPDLNGFDKWKAKALELSSIENFTVSDLLELKAREAEKKQGLDLADYLIQFDLREFVLPVKETLPAEQPPPVHPLIKPNHFEATEPNYYFSKPETSKPETWEQDISELETFFTGINLPTQPVKPNPYSIITDFPKFLDSHFATVKANKGKRTFLPYLNRLQELKQYLTTNSI